MVSSRQSVLLLVLLVAVATLPYAQSLSMGFVYDDHAQIGDNPNLRVWPGFARVFSSDVWSMTDVDVTSNYYRPFMWIAYNAVFVVAGASPWAFHLLNLLLHAGVTLLVFALTRRLWKSREAGVIAALLFAIHPVHVEPVVWIGALPELAFTGCILAAFYFHAFTDEDAAGSVPRGEGPSLVASLAFYGAGLLWKESALAFLPLAFAYDVVVLRQFRLKRYVGLALMTLVYFVLRANALGGLAPRVIRPGVSLSAQVLTAIANIGFYVGKLLVPVHLSLYYRMEIITGITLTVALVVLGVAVSAWKLRGKDAFAVLWIVASLMPVLLVTRVASPLADRSLYLASVGFCWLVAHGVVALGRGTRRVVPVLTILLVAGSGLLSVARVPDWKDDMALLDSALRVDPENATAQLNRASELGRQGRYAEQLAALDRVLVSAPDHQDALLSRAEALVYLKHWPQVEATCAHLLTLSPESPRCDLYLGLVAQEKGLGQEAWMRFEQAYRGNPRLWQAPFYQGMLALAAGDVNVAEAKFKVTAAQHPSAQVFNNLGIVYLRKGQAEPAIAAFREALRVDPSHELARKNLDALLHRSPSR